MNIRIELNDDITEDEVIIRCRQVTENIQHLQKLISEEAGGLKRMTFFKGNEEYYFPMDQVLFFETSKDNVYAHTAADIYRIKFRLYELEDLLPRPFVRISKSTIVNVEHIMMVSRNLSSSSQIQFHKSHKQVYASRLYYKNLRQRLNERSSYED